MEYNEALLCRACLGSDSTEYAAMESQMTVDFSIIECFNKCTNLKATIDDELPMNICCNCLSSLKIAFDFAQTAQHADAILHQKLVEPKMQLIHEREDERMIKVPSFEQIEYVELSDVKEVHLSAFHLEDVAYGDIEDDATLQSNDKSDTLSAFTMDETTQQQHLQTPQPLAEDNLEQRNASCDICQERFHLAREVLDHKRVKHFECEECRRYFESKEAQEKHIMLIHPYSDITHIQCPYCTRSPFAKEVLVDHLRSNHSGEYQKIAPLSSQQQTGINVTPWRCDVCSRYCRTEAMLKDHRNNHTNERPYGCRLCGKNYTSARNLREHMRRLHRPEYEKYLVETQGSLVYCRKCEKVILRKNIRKHKKFHERKMEKKGSTENTFCIRTYITEYLEQSKETHTAKEGDKTDLQEGIDNQKVIKESHTEEEEYGEAKHDEVIENHKEVKEIKPLSGEIINDETTEQHFGKSNETTEQQHPGKSKVKKLISRIGKRRKMRRSKIQKCIKPYHSAKDNMEKMFTACDICTKNFRLCKEMLEHKHLDHFGCKKCDVYFKLKETLDEHMKLIHPAANNGYIQCPYCTDIPFTKNLFVDHLRSVHYDEYNIIVPIPSQKVPEIKMKSWQCDVCLRYYRTETLLKDHRNKHSNIRPYECLSCCKRFFSVKNLRQHMQGVHQAEYEKYLAETQGSIVYCKICRKAILRRNIKKHKKVHELRMKKGNLFEKAFFESNYIIEYDTQSKQIPTGAKENLKTEHDEAIKDHEEFETLSAEASNTTTEQLYEAQSQLDNLEKSASIQKHDKIYRSKIQKYVAKHNLSEKETNMFLYDQRCNKPYKCAECRRNFYSKDELEEHASEHNNLDVACEICEKQFSLGKELLEHKRLKHYGCNVCGKYYESEETLQEHTNLIHPSSDITHQKCPYCTHSPLRKQVFVEHLRSMHSVEFLKLAPILSKQIPERKITPWQCEVCLRYYRSEAILNDHRNKHTNERPYECCVCDRRYFTSKNLRDHMQRLHQAEYEKYLAETHVSLVYCEICRKAILRRNIRKHQKVHERRMENEFFAESLPSSYITEYEEQSTEVHKKVEESPTTEDDKEIRTMEELETLFYEIIDESTTEQQLIEKIQVEDLAIDDDSSFMKKSPDGRGRPYKCTQCRRKFSNREELETHTEESHDPSNAICDLCEKPFGKGKELFEHKRLEHKALEGCTECYKYFVSVEELNIHKKLIHPPNENTPIHCPHCSHPPLPKIYLLEHLRLKHSAEYRKHIDCESQPTDEVRVTQWQCDQCSLYCRSEAMLRDHLNKHTNARPYVCKVCSKRFSSTRNVSEHIRKQHRLEYEKQLTENSKGIVTCKICDKTVLKKNFGNHKIAHEQGNKNSPPSVQKRYICAYCSKSFDQIYPLKKHEEKHDPSRTKKFSCNECDTKFYTSRAMTKHIRNKHNSTTEKKFICPVCGNAYKGQKNLDLHYQLHVERKVPCTLCERRFLRVDDLKIHMRHHTGEKPFACHLCDKRFVIKASLTYHLEKHTGMKKICKICGAGFVGYARLHEHMFEHTGMPYRCEECSAEYTRRERFATHIRRAHKRTPTDNELDLNFARHTGKRPHVTQILETPNET